MLKSFLQRLAGSAASARPHATTSNLPQPGERRCIAFIIATEEARRIRPTDRFFSPLASTRLRVLIPAQQLAARVPVWLVPIEEFLRRPMLDHLGEPVAIVIAKLATGRVLNLKEPLTQLLRLLRAGSGRAPVYADLSDDYVGFAAALHEPFLAEYQQGLGETCHLVVPCEALHALLAPVAGRGISVVEDPYESIANKPVRVELSAPIRLAWFGNLGSPNLPPLKLGFGAIAEDLRNTDVNLELVAGEESRGLVEKLVAHLRNINPRVVVRFSVWSPDTVAAAIEACDLVVIPQDDAADWSRVKSHNRLVETIRGGKLAIASPIPSYVELQDFAWIGHDFAEGIRWVRADPVQAAQRVVLGQAYVESRFSPEAIGRKWASVLGIT